MATSTIVMITLGLSAGGFGLFMAILAALANDIDVAGAVITIALFVTLALLGGALYNLAVTGDGHEKLQSPSLTCPLERVP